MKLAACTKDQLDTNKLRNFSTAPFKSDFWSIWSFITLWYSGGDGGHKATYKHIVMEYFNHSCKPNVALSWMDGIVSGSVMRPIKENEQLFISHSFRCIDEFYRRKGITKELKLKCFDFICTCRVCQLSHDLQINLELRKDPLFESVEYRLSKVQNSSYRRKQIEAIRNYCFVIVLLESLLLHPNVKPFSEIAMVTCRDTRTT